MGHQTFRELQHQQRSRRAHRPRKVAGFALLPDVFVQPPGQKGRVVLGEPLFRKALAWITDNPDQETPSGNVS